MKTTNRSERSVGARTATRNPSEERDDVMSKAKAHGEQSAAMPSPFPPIEDYAFLSDCHTGALVAPDGGVAWLCVPRFDSPSVFGTLLDREAGYFRLGPFGINVPTTRAYEPGTNIVSTTWNTPGGWVVVRDALTMGPRQGEDVVTPHTRPPADDDADHVLVRTATCIDGQVEVELVCEPVFDYGRTVGDVDADGRRSSHGRRHRAQVRPSGCRPTWRWASKAAGCAPGTSWGRASRSTARCPGPRAWPHRVTSTKPMRVWTPPRVSGGPGCGGHARSTTRTGPRWSARRS